MPDPVKDMREQILAVVKKIHYNDHDFIRTFSKLNFYLEDYDGVAAKSGAPPEITITVSVRHILNVYNNSGGDYNAIRVEILGILSHEGTHGYQYEPYTLELMMGSSEFYGFIEGLADYVSIPLDCILEDFLQQAEAGEADIPLQDFLLTGWFRKRIQTLQSNSTTLRELMQLGHGMQHVEKFWSRSSGIVG